MRFLSITLAVLLATAPVAEGQKFRVAVSMSDSAAEGVFGSAFSAAFRALGDVEVVSLREKPEFVLSGVVLCNISDCASAVSYSLSLRLYSPFSPAMGLRLAAALIPALPAETRATRLDSATSQVNSLMASYELTRMSWSANWGRQRYEQAIVEFVRQVDSHCLEPQRVIRRAVAGASSGSGFGAIDAYNDMIKTLDWSC